jgi:aryl-alcohol dehydrogenase-like predicted oxidoreductase
VQQLQNIADDAGLPLPVMSLAWVLQNPAVSTAIIGASRPEQVRANARASGVRLDAETMKRIDEVLDPIVERDPGKSQQLEKRP